MTAQQFCDECDVSLDLHPQPYDEDDPGCEAAEMRAKVWDVFARAMFSDQR